MLEPARTDAAPAPDAAMAPPRVVPTDPSGDPAGPGRAVGNGRYLLLAPLGEGGTATVYRAMDRVLGIERAVKVLSAELAPGDDHRRRLVAEARVMSHLEHRHVLPIYDVGSDDGRAFVVMALAPSGTLHDRLNSEGPLCPEYAATRMVEVLDALGAAHDAGFVHRDVKPANILLGTDERAMLADFGIALLATEEAARPTHRFPHRFDMGRNGVALGSFSYMPPEQRFDARSVGPAADLYAAGATLYALVTNMSPVDLFLAGPTSPRWSPVPLALRAVLARATSLSPEDRYATAADFADALRAVLPELEGLDAMPWGPDASSLIVRSPVPAEPTEPRPSVLAWIGMAALAGITAVAMVVWTRPAELPRISGNVLSAQSLPSSFSEPDPPVAEASVAVAQRWVGALGGGSADLTLSGPTLPAPTLSGPTLPASEAARSGTLTMRRGDRVVVTALTGTLEVPTRTLRLEERGSAGAIVGRYTLTIAEDGGRLNGHYDADGAPRVGVQMRRIP